ncbi:MAG: hypothetical protein ACRELE_06510, partial [Gemmatimonadales bacterium]
MKPLTLLVAMVTFAMPAGRSELRVPACTGYLSPDPDVVAVSATQPVTPFLKAGARLQWYGHFKTVGTIHAAVAIVLAR